MESWAGMCLGKALVCTLSVLILTHLCQMDTSLLLGDPQMSIYCGILTDRNICVAIC